MSPVVARVTAIRRRGRSAQGMNAPTEAHSAPCVQPAMGRHLHGVLVRAGLSIDHVAQFSGLKRGRLQAILGGTEVPSVNVLWRIANATGLPFGSLVPTSRPDSVVVQRKTERLIFTSPEGGFRMQPMLPFDANRRVDFFEVTVSAGHRQDSPAHVPGTLASLVVLHGKTEIVAGRDPPQVLGIGDVMIFQADVPHSYRCLGNEDAVMHVVTSYSDLAR